MWCQRVPEKNEELNLPFGDPGANLLIASQRSTLELLNRQAQLFLYQRSRGTRRAQRIIRKNVAMPLHPFDEFPLLVVVGNESMQLRDLLILLPPRFST